MPDLGLVCDKSFPFVVYVLGCEGGFVYVGITKKHQARRRLQDHLDGNGRHCTRERKPNAILLVYPATSAAVEAYVYYTLLAQYSASSVYRLGDWTTGTRLSPLASLMIEREHRLLNNQCLKCGSASHFAKDCRAAPSSRDYTCGACRSTVRIMNDDASTTISRPSIIAKPQCPTAVTVDAPRKRAASSSSPSQPAQKTVKTVAPTRVLICEVEYSSLAWYLGKSDPTPRERSIVIQKCGEHRV